VLTSARGFDFVQWYTHKERENTNHTSHYSVDAPKKKIMEKPKDCKTHNWKVST